MRFVFVAIVTTGILLASDPWTKATEKWTSADAQRILTASPWAQQTNATFGSQDDREPPPPGPLPGAPEAGMAGPRGAGDGHWDGGVGRMPRGTVPALPVLIRWDSALPIRAAVERADASKLDITPVTQEQASRDYVLTLIGLIPANRYRAQGQLTSTSSSDDANDVRDPEQLLEGLMATSRLRKGKWSLVPENVKLDAATGTVHIYFSRANGLDAGDKDVTFTTRFGALTVQKVFHLKDMVYKGRLEL